MKSVIAVVTVTVTLAGIVAMAQEPKAGMPDNIVAELDNLVGSWDAKGKVGEKEQKGEFRCRWGRGPDKKKCCLIGFFSYATGDETRSGVTLIGWNAATKCIDDRAFDTGGGCDTLSWTVKSPTEWHGEMVLIKDGQEVRSKLVLVKKGPSELVVESENEKGEVSRVVYKKVAKTSKGKARE